MCDYSAKKLADSVHDMVSKLTGARKRSRCPECGSKEWYRQDHYSRSIVEYEDGHSDEYEDDLYWDYSIRVCYECGYDDD